MDLLKTAATFIAWLSGSLAAIAAILYGLGFLVTLSNLHLLGLDPLVLSFEPAFYVQRGAKFTLYVVRLMFKVLLGPLVVLVIVTALLALVRKFGSADRAFARVQDAVLALAGKRDAWPIVAYSLLLLILLIQMLPTYANLTDLLNVSDLLFEPADADTARYDPEARAVRDALLRRDTSDPTPAALLGTKFLFAVFFFLESAVMFWLAWWLTLRWRARALLITPFALVLAMFLVSLPMIYGVIVLPNQFATARIVTKAGREGIDGEYFLLNRTADALVLWNQREAGLLWLPLSEVETLKIGATRPLPLAGKPPSDGRESDPGVR